jgi:hypothetical protein
MRWSKEEMKMIDKFRASLGIPKDKSTANTDVRISPRVIRRRVGSKFAPISN